ncbi:ABC transporter permease, partial [Burkholderia sp. SIMBA_019]
MSATSTPTPALRRESPWRRNLLEFLSSRTAVFGLVIATLLILAAVLAPW